MKESKGTPDDTYWGIFYFDKNGNIVSETEAVRCVIRECTKSGELIAETWGTVNQRIAEGSTNTTATSTGYLSIISGTNKVKRHRPVWWDWATFGDDGFLNGISEDAPDEMKEAYMDFLREQQEYRDKGIKV